MLSLESLTIDGIIYSVKNDRDTTSLIKHLKNGGKVTAELSLIIADILEGKIKAAPVGKNNPKSVSARRNLKWKLKKHIEYCTAGLTEKSGYEWSWDETKLELKRAGISSDCDLDTKGGITKVAKLLAGHHFGITPSQLDEIINPRKLREKNR